MKLPNIILFLFVTIGLQAQNKTLIIGIDGVRPDALAAANTPNIDNLITGGLYSPHALNDDITISGPGWSAILCGVWSDKHEVLNNDFSDNNYLEYPTFFKYVEEHDPSLHTVSFVNWNPINDFIIQDYADFKLNLGTDAEVASQSAAYLSNNDPDLFFLHFDDVDHAGHAYGFSPNVSEYISAIEGADNHLGTVMDGLLARPNYDSEDWLILVTTDHGGQGFSHGGSTPQEEQVFFIANGGNVTPSLLLRDSTLVPDNPVNCLEDTVELQFDGINDFVEVPESPVFDFGENQDFTIECRVRTTIAADVSIIGNKDWDSGLNPGFVFSFRYASGPEWKVNIGDGTNRVDIDSGGEVADNEWHTLSVSFDRDGDMRMYEDGAFITAADISGIGNINTNEGLFFGADILGEYLYQGAIAEVRVWNTIVAPQEISDWACSSLEDTHPNWQDLLGYWKLNEGTGGVVADELGNNDGVINGASWNTYDSIVVYNYDNTPRLTDITTTALTHLCVPINDNWNLEGNSWVTDCMMTNTTAVESESKMSLSLFPNPAGNRVSVRLKNLPLQGKNILNVFDVNGTLVKEILLTDDTKELQIDDLPSGVYLIAVVSENKTLTEQLIKL